MKSNATLDILLSRNFLLSFLSFFFLWISFDFFILFPLFILQAGGSAVDVGIQTAIFFFPAVVMRPLAGWFTDRIGRLRVLWFGSLLMILSAFALLLLKGSYQQVKFWMAFFLLCRGLGFASFYTAFFTYVTDLSLPENRARVLGLFGVSGLVAHGLAPRIGEITLHHFQFHGFFLVSGILSLISLFISVFLKEIRAATKQKESGFVIVKSVTVSRKNWMILPGAFTFGFVLASFNTFGAAYFKESGGASVGYFFMAYGLMAGFVRILLGGIADRYERWKLIVVSFGLLSAGISVIVLQPVDHFYLVAAGLAGGAHGILFPTMAAMAVDAHPEEFRGVVTSIFTAAIELGFSLGSYILGVVVDMENYRFMFLTCSVFALLFAIYVLVVRLVIRKQPTAV